MKIFPVTPLVILGDVVTMWFGQAIGAVTDDHGSAQVTLPLMLVRSRMHLGIFVDEVP